VFLANRLETEHWLLDHGYAVAGSDYTGRYGFAVEDALRDQIGVLDWFAANVGRPRRTVTNGMSMGGLISVLLAERNPRRFDGVLAGCAEYDSYGIWNFALDLTFTVKVLLAGDPGIELVRAADPARSVQLLQQAVQAALTSPAGRARLALAGSLGNLDGWGSAHTPRPTDLDSWIRDQAFWTEWAYIVGLGPAGRLDLERRAGGNPSWNVGVDYRRQLARSAFGDRVREAYRVAGLDLDADLARLNAAPRIAPDPPAVAYMYRYTVARGTTPSPVLTLHNTGDGGAPPDQERWYAGQVRDPGRLRQVFVDRGSHCSFTAADEIVALKTLFARVESGRWPDTSPGRLNAAVSAFDQQHQSIFNFATNADEAVAPAFTRFQPPYPLRPSR
jgi:dienelactone hydrolase